jgi:hypothetical protein
VFGQMFILGASQVPRISVENSRRKGGLHDGALQAMFKKILGILFHMCGRLKTITLSSETLKHEAQEMIDGLVVHFAVLMLNSKVVKTPATSNDMLHPSLYLEGLILHIGALHRPTSAVAAHSFGRFITSCVTLCGSKHVCAKLPFWEVVTQQLLHLCFERGWYKKTGGCLGLRLLIDNLGETWASPIQVLRRFACVIIIVLLLLLLLLLFMYFKLASHNY